jgi:hypothetical protein
VSAPQGCACALSEMTPGGAPRTGQGSAWAGRWALVDEVGLLLGWRAWAHHHASEGRPGFAEGTAVVVDEQGQVYVTGRSSKRPSSSDCFTAKYAVDGRELWSRRFSSVSRSSDAGQAIALDAAGNVHLAGQTWTGTASTT